MKMLRINVDKKAFLKKLCIYLLICYMMASWGVNETLNPLQYITGISMEKINLEAVQEENYIFVDLSHNNKEAEYISFIADIRESFVGETVIEAYVDEKLVRTETDTLHRGYNWIKISSEWSSLRFVAEDITLDEMVLSEVPVLDAVKMLGIMFSLLCLLAFWELVKHIKKIYTA